MNSLTAEARQDDATRCFAKTGRDSMICLADNTIRVSSYIEVLNGDDIVPGLEVSGAEAAEPQLDVLGLANRKMADGGNA